MYDKEAKKNQIQRNKASIKSKVKELKDGSKLMIAQVNKYFPRRSVVTPNLACLTPEQINKLFS